MRLLSFILAMMILVLSCIPCSDTGIIYPQNESTVSLSIPCEHSQNQHDDCCSPFCQCSCCAGISMPVWATPFTLSRVINLPRLYNDYRTTTAPDVFLPIWQPPQLV
jgi:hypothetical protein